jgi:hypothetical protein
LEKASQVAAVFLGRPIVTQPSFGYSATTPGCVWSGSHVSSLQPINAMDAHWR